MVPKEQKISLTFLSEENVRFLTLFECLLFFENNYAHKTSPRYKERDEFFHKFQKNTKLQKFIPELLKKDNKSTKDVSVIFTFQRCLNSFKDNDRPQVSELETLYSEHVRIESHRRVVSRKERDELLRQVQILRELRSAYVNFCSGQFNQRCLTLNKKELLIDNRTHICDILSTQRRMKKRVIQGASQFEHSSPVDVPSNSISQHFYNWRDKNKISGEVQQR